MQHATPKDSQPKTSAETQAICKCHQTAADHHEAACKCHKEAIKCHEAGDHKAAAACSEKASAHSAKAAEADKECKSKTATLHTTKK